MIGSVFLVIHHRLAVVDKKKKVIIFVNFEWLISSIASWPFAAPVASAQTAVTGHVVRDALFGVGLELASR